MAENDQAAAVNPEASEQRFSLQRIYVKDLSFESPNSPDIFQQKYGQKADFKLNTRHKFIDSTFYEVVLKVSVEAKHEDNTLFLAEVEQAGIFDIHGIEGATLDHLLGSMCPSILFPYARETIDTLLLKGTFPPLMLDPVNFDAIYSQSIPQNTVQ